jgi:hypothetical protein
MSGVSLITSFISQRTITIDAVARTCVFPGPELLFREYSYAYHRGLLLNQQHRSEIHVSNCSTVSLLSDRSILKRLAGGSGGPHVNASGITKGGRVFARGLQILDGRRRLERAMREVFGLCSRGQLRGSKKKNGISFGGAHYCCAQSA